MRIIYWSQTGNTEKIAELIKKGIELEGKSAKLVKVSDITVEYIKNEEIIIIGCPACGVETLDETEMEPFINSLQGEIDGKKVALFGSYGWGTGEWMEAWQERMQSYGGVLISDGLIVNEEEIDNNSEIIEFGKLIAKQ
ncbi:MULTISPECIES: flavodoxin [unclassified Clostridium]|uniref:flavodoxin n=1 Tax=unclassified Clostridium TaxID=2614128 RepID=UPI001C8B1083|nr:MULTISPECIES: flavodoxin [unclassified Clostridium]MBX9136478.1 flavodoxin [Clostridium sp. K12(2020)]MBX9143041.1 flavodoxin [Clostridium sp. K13]